MIKSSTRISKKVFVKIVKNPNIWQYIFFFFGSRLDARNWVRAIAVSCKVRIKASMDPLVGRVEVIPLFHLKRPSFRTGSGARITIRWRQLPRARRKKPLAVLLRSLWVRAWSAQRLVPAAWSVAHHHKVQGRLNFMCMP